MRHRTNIMIISSLCIWFAAISIGFDGAEHGHLADGSASGACGMDLIWPSFRRDHSDGLGQPTGCGLLKVVGKMFTVRESVAPRDCLATYS